jgi:hypothetical protein
VTSETTDLATLIRRARAADRGSRIELRDPVASHGQAGINAVADWIANEELGAFAVRVIEAAAKVTGPGVALQQLRISRSRAATPKIAGDIEDSIIRLGGGTSPQRPGDRFSVPSIPEASGGGWPGFQPRDFDGIAGTTWRQRDGRTSLAPNLVRALQYRHPHVMSFGIQRSPELHLALTDRYRLGDEPESGWRAAKLVVYAKGPNADMPTMPREVVAGLYVEKGSLSEASRFGIVDDQSWDWPWFIRALEDRHAQDELARALVRHDLRIGDYVGGRFSPKGDRLGFVGRMEDGALTIRATDGTWIETGFEALAARLRALPIEDWHSFHIWRTWAAEEAISAGPGFVNAELLPVLGDLFDVYLDIVGPTLSGS